MSDGSVSFDPEAAQSVADALGRIGDAVACGEFGMDVPGAAGPVVGSVVEFEGAVRRCREEFAVELQAFGAAVRVLVDDVHNADRWSG